MYCLDNDQTHFKLNCILTVVKLQQIVITAEIARTGKNAVQIVVTAKIAKTGSMFKNR